MDFFILVKITLILVSIVAYFSFQGDKREAESNAKKLLDNDEEGEIFATEEEVRALEKTHDIALPDSVPIIHANGPVVVTTLTTTGAAAETLVTICGMKVHMPCSIFLSVETVLPPEGEARLAKVDDKLYVLAMGNYSLVSDVHSDALNDATVDAIGAGKRGKIETLPLEVLGQRDASDIERRYYDAPTQGKRYAIPMMSVFIASAYLLYGKDEAAGWLVSFGLTFIVGFGFWWRELKRERETYKITRLQGRVNEVVNNALEQYIRVYDESEAKGSVTFQLPGHWTKDIHLDTEVIFEVCNETQTLVSYRHTHSLERDIKVNGQKTEPYLGWMAGTTAVVALSLFFTLYMPHAVLSVDMLKNQQTVNIEQFSDWDGVVDRGQRISLPNAHRQCRAEMSAGGDDIDWPNFCSTYVVVSSSVPVDLMETLTPTLDELSTFEDQLSFPEIPLSQYSMLKLYASLAGNDVIAHENIADVRHSSLHAWAVWLEKNTERSDYDQTKALLLSLWAEAKEIDVCEAQCWSELLTANFDTEGQYSMLKSRYELGNLRDIRIDHVNKHFRDELNRWAEGLSSNELQSNSNTKISVTNAEPFTDIWEEVLGYGGFYSSRSAEDYRTALSDAESVLAEFQNSTLDYAVVTSVEASDGGKSIMLDVSMTEARFYSYIAQLGLMLLGVVLSIVFVVMLMKQSGRQDHVSHGSLQSSSTLG
ncbi:hypothetical protein [Enterovibrio calviensis]|uniref:hypothetical protein n=1 Tax=Enterovibrio calviensis TaxID=91359 RepID=UPI00373545EE